MHGACLHKTSRRDAIARDPRRDRDETLVCLEIETSRPRPNPCGQHVGLAIVNSVPIHSQSGRYQVVTTWMGDCLRSGKPSRYVANTKVNSAFHPSRVGKTSTGLSGLGYGGARSRSGWQVTVCDAIWPATYGHISVALRWIFYEEPHHNHFKHFNNRHHHHRDAKRSATAYPAVVLCRKNNLSSPISRAYSRFPADLMDPGGGKSISSMSGYGLTPSWARSWSKGSGLLGHYWRVWQRDRIIKPSFANDGWSRQTDR